jgi:predicted nucleic acid-binding protein
MNVEKILIDTSNKVDEILSKKEVYVPKIVIAELIQGAKSEREVSIIRDFLEAFSIIDQTEDTWFKAGELSFNLKKKGNIVNLTDCYIAVIAQEHSCQIFTLDEHFKDIQKSLKIVLINH